MSAVAASGPPVAPDRTAQFRYGAVLLLILALLVFEIVAPASNWARAVSIALAGAGLTVAVATSRARGSVRRLRGVAVSAMALAAVGCVGAGLVSQGVADGLLAVTVACIPVALASGLLRLMSQSGVTLQAVAGALAIYLLIGLLFASAIGVVAHLETGSFFTQATGVTDGDRVYYSFTVMTTTGFGDYTAATPTGHALAVLEMLTGQLYLVTVIGLLVGNFARKRQRRDQDD